MTGSCGLIGSEVTRSFARRGFSVTGIDSNHRAVFFGPEGDTSWVLGQLQSEIPDYRHSRVDIRDRGAVLALMEELKPDLIIHTAAQPSHDRAAAIPFLDFEVNALGTLHLLEAARRFCPESPFIHMSTNKVYGDRPNTLPLAELETRWDYADPAFEHGIAEDFSIDQSKHSHLWRIQGRRRRHGAGVRALFRHAHLLPARRMPDRTRITRAWNCTAFSAIC